MGLWSRCFFFWTDSAACWWNLPLNLVHPWISVRLSMGGQTNTIKKSKAPVHSNAPMGFFFQTTSRLLQTKSWTLSKLFCFPSCLCFGSVTRCGLLVMKAFFLLLKLYTTQYFSSSWKLNWMEGMFQIERKVTYLYNIFYLFIYNTFNLFYFNKVKHDRIKCSSSS